MRALSRLPLAAALATLLVAACAETFTPASVVEDLRVLAIVADPPELRLLPTATTNTVTVLHAISVAPPATPGGPPAEPAPADVSWTFCPFSVGASVAYACAIPACESTLQPSADGSVTLDPLAELSRPACQAALSAAAPGGAGAGTAPAPVAIEMLARYQATLGGLRREAVQRIPVWLSPPPAEAANLNPVITSASTGPDCAGGAPGCAVGAVSVTVDVDPASIQTYRAGPEGDVAETVVVSFFTTAGRFKHERGQATAGAPQTGTTLEAKELGGARDAWVWVVARDLRGGEAVAGPLRVVFSVP